MPVVLGSSSLRIAECDPPADGFTLTVRFAGVPFPRLIDVTPPGRLNVPSFPTHERL